MAPIDINNQNIDSVEVNGQSVDEISVDGDVVFSAAGSPPFIESWEGAFPGDWESKTGSGISSLTQTTTDPFDGNKHIEQTARTEPIYIDVSQFGFNQNDGMKLECRVKQGAASNFRFGWGILNANGDGYAGWYDSVPNEYSFFEIEDFERVNRYNRPRRGGFSNTYKNATMTVDGSQITREIEGGIGPITRTQTEHTGLGAYIWLWNLDDGGRHDLIKMDVL
jgi:hypothetical protein